MLTFESESIFVSSWNKRVYNLSLSVLLFMEMPMALKYFWLENEPKLWHSDITYGVKKDQNVKSHFWLLTFFSTTWFLIMFSTKWFLIMFLTKWFLTFWSSKKYFQSSDPSTFWFLTFRPPLLLTTQIYFLI